MMENRYTTESLKEQIKELEIRQSSEAEIFKQELLVTYETLKPANILKNVVKEFYSSEILKDELISTAISVSSGFITKKLLVGKSNNQILKLVGLAIQFGMTTLISNKFKTLKDAAIQFIDRFTAEKADNQ